MFECYICGFTNLDEPPWGEDSITPNFQICPCCGVTFGYEDLTEKGRKYYRKTWILEGANWFQEELKPIDWDLKKQLLKINVKLEDL
jgi:hypothetical protein